MYIVDRIEENIVVLEDSNTRNIINVDINLFDIRPEEGNVYSYDGSLFIKDINKETDRRKEISNLFNKLKK